MAVPYIFSTVPGGSSIPLSELDANFAYLTGSPTLSSLAITGGLSVNGPSSFLGPITAASSITSGPLSCTTLTAVGPSTLGLLTTLTNLTVTGTSNFTGPISAGAITSASLTTGPITAGAITGSSVSAPTITSPSITGTAISATGSFNLGGTLTVDADTVNPTGITGTGKIVLSDTPLLNLPTFVSPTLGTPLSGNLANCTGYPAANVSGVISIAQGGTGATTAAAAANALLPSQAGNANKVLTTDGAGVLSWATDAQAQPGGATTQVQFNNAGAFDGSPNLVWLNASSRLGVGTTAPTAPVTVQAAYTPGIGQIDVLNTGNFQQITLRDPSNPAPDSRNLAIAGNYIAGVPNGYVISTGNLYLGSNGLTPGPHISILTNNNVQINFGKLVIGDANTVTVRNNAASANWTMTLPATSGSSGQVLSTDGAGNTTWATSAGSGPLFRATSNILQPCAANAFTLMAMNTLDPSTAVPAAGQYDLAAYKFQPTVPGYYTITAIIYGTAVIPGSGISSLFSLIYKNGVAIERNGTTTTNPSGASANLQMSAMVTTIVYLNGTTDFVQAYNFCTDTFTTNTPFTNFTTWNGSFLRSP